MRSHEPCAAQYTSGATPEMEGRVNIRRLWVPSLLVAALGAVLLLGVGGANAQENTLTIRAGSGSNGNWVNLFLPKDVTILTGDTLSWRVESGEPHSITFILGEPPAGDLPVTPSPVTIPDDGPVVNSDIIFGGNPANPPTFDATFSEAGTYDYLCIIHPFMTGTVTVLDPDDPEADSADTQESADARGDLEEAPALAEGQQNDAAVRARVPAAVTQPGGTKEYSVILGGETRDTQQNIMYPASLSLTAGDTIRFINETPIPHSATFGEMPPGDPFAAPPTENTDPGNGVVHTGLFTATGEPPATTPDSRVITFSKPGTYDFYCLLHPEMQGSVTVAAAPAPPTPTPAPPTPTPPAPRPPNTGSGASGPANSATGLYVVLGIVALAGVVAATAFATANRNR